MAKWYDVSSTLHSITIPACFKVWVIQNGENRWQIEIARRAKIAESDTLEDAKAEALI